jgi:hypothetical protein
MSDNGYAVIYNSTVANPAPGNTAFVNCRFVDYVSTNSTDVLYPGYPNQLVWTPPFFAARKEFVYCQYCKQALNSDGHCDYCGGPQG